MRKLLVSSVLLACIFVVTTRISPLAAQDLEAGDQVELVVRDIHIPAHPAPGDNRVPFRYTSGSTAVVLSSDPSTGWIEVRGEELDGGERVGWIVDRYIVGPVDREEGTGSESPALGWCPSKGSPDPVHSARLRLASWNLGNLHAEDGQSVFTGSDPSVRRFSIDYSRIRCYVRLFDPDILAVQEVDEEEALRRVVDEDVYEVYVSDRPEAGFMNGKQNTGFAYKRGLSVQEQPDFEDLDVSNGFLRHGTRIEVSFGDQTLSLMSVHLKSGCFSNSNSGSTCNKLFNQVTELEEWIDSEATDPDPFIILGDFNRRLNLSQDIVWGEIDDGQPPNADLLTVTENMPISCRDNEFTRFIDHIVFDLRGAQLVDRSSFRHVTYRQDDRPVWDKISDHCPVVVEIWAGQ